jgi:hypothetical protein
MEVMEYRGLHQDVEEPRDLRVRPVGVPVPLVRPSLAVQARVNNAIQTVSWHLSEYNNPNRTVKLAGI